MAFLGSMEIGQLTGCILKDAASSSPLRVDVTAFVVCRRPTATSYGVEPGNTKARLADLPFSVPTHAQTVHSRVQEY